MLSTICGKILCSFFLLKQVVQIFSVFFKLLKLYFMRSPSYFKNRILILGNSDFIYTGHIVNDVMYEVIMDVNNIYDTRNTYRILDGEP
jgi:hypothetical protein